MMMLMCMQSFLLNIYVYNSEVPYLHSTYHKVTEEILRLTCLTFHVSEREREAGGPEGGIFVILIRP